MSEDSLTRFLSGNSPGRRARPHVDPDIEAERLRDACALFLREHRLEVGNLVAFKRGILIQSHWPEGVPPPLVVLQVFPDAPICLDVGDDMSHYGICFDVIVGYYDEDNDFVFAPMDSRRLEPWSCPPKDG